MQDFENVMVLGVAGNFAGHLQQAGEADDFAAHGDGDINKPQALFPIYVPSINHSYLATYPLSHSVTKLPNDINNLQIEPEVVLLCDVSYYEGKVSKVTPTHFGAFNDCSIRRPNAKKISEKKNWGEESKGIAENLLPLGSLVPGSEIDRFRIASFHKRNGEVFAYGEDCSVSEYTYFYCQLLDWIRDQMNQQTDLGPMENIHALLEQANFPNQILVAIGATRYTAYGEEHFLERGDVSMVAVYDSTVYEPNDISAMAQKGKFESDRLSHVVQCVS